MPPKPRGPRSGGAPVRRIAPELSIAPASSSRMRRSAGRGRLAVGDAAAAFDPLSSQGVCWALDSGRVAAQAVEHHLRGDRGAFRAYAQWVNACFAAYLETRA